MDHSSISYAMGSARACSNHVSVDIFLHIFPIRRPDSSPDSWPDELSYIFGDRVIEQVFIIIIYTSTT
jgi:hypothetical protein